MPKHRKGKAMPAAKPRKMHVEGFAEEVKRIDATMKNRRFAFILGAGASKSSGVKTGGEFVREWLEILFQRDPDRGKRSFDQWLKETKAGIPNLDPTKLAESYPAVYEATFQHDPDAGYAYLEDAMAGADPRYGYAVLAYILETTQHKVVITVNFDNLVADALANYSNTFPLVCGHDSLAGFAQPNLRRPLILKVHHDLFYGPKSSPEEIANIGSEYKHAVERLLQHYTPIVIGYGGNDGSLMSVLEQLPERSVPGGIYWCYLTSTAEPRTQILDVVARQDGWLVPISGFDELMAMLGDKLGFALPDQRIKERAEKRADALVEHAKELRTKIQNQQTLVPDDGKRRKPATKDQQKSLNAALESLETTMQRTTDGKKRWWQWEEMAAKERDRNPDQADQIYQQAVQELPNSVPLLGNYATFLKNVRKDHDRAQEYYERALKADPNNATTLGNYANFLTDVRKNHDRAQEYYERALKADPNNATTLGNYANFLTGVRKDHDRAQEYYEQALKADPNRANTLGNYAGMMFALGKVELANKLLQRAIMAEAKDPALDLAAELLFYAFANGPEEGRAKAFARLKRLLVEQGARSPDWDLSRNVERAVKDGHPDSAWLSKLAAVINGSDDPRILDEWSAWRNAQ